MTVIASKDSAKRDIANHVSSFDSSLRKAETKDRAPSSAQTSPVAIAMSAAPAAISSPSPSASLMPFRVWTGNRKVKKSLVAASCVDIIEKAAKKVGISGRLIPMSRMKA